MPARKKPERSKIASDPNRPLIERSLAMGVPMKQIAKRFGYSEGAILRYRDRMPQQLKAAIVAAALKPKETDLDQLRIDESEGILGNLAHQRARLLLCQDECMEAGVVEHVARLSNTIHRNIELTGRYLGLFAQHHVSSQVNIMISEDYLRLRQSLTMALRPFPEARRAVAEELHRIEGEIAQKMLEQHTAAQGRPREPLPSPPSQVIDRPPLPATALHPRRIHGLWSARDEASMLNPYAWRRRAAASLRVSARLLAVHRDDIAEVRRQLTHRLDRLDSVLIPLQQAIDQLDALSIDPGARLHKRLPVRVPRQVRDRIAAAAKAAGGAL